MKTALHIQRFRPEDRADILAALKADPDWEILTNEKTIDAYAKALENGVTYVGIMDRAFCGFVRGVLDPGIAIYVSELYVMSHWRGQGVGQALLARLQADHGALKAYALSDEDLYYEKKGFTRIGSVFSL